MSFADPLEGTRRPSFSAALAPIADGCDGVQACTLLGYYYPAEDAAGDWRSSDRQTRLQLPKKRLPRIAFRQGLDIVHQGKTVNAPEIDNQLFRRSLRTDQRIRLVGHLQERR